MFRIWGELFAYLYIIFMEKIIILIKHILFLITDTYWNSSNLTFELQILKWKEIWNLAVVFFLSPFSFPIFTKKYYKLLMYHVQKYFFFTLNINQDIANSLRRTKIHTYTIMTHVSMIELYMIILPIPISSHHSWYWAKKVPSSGFQTFLISF